MHTGVAKWLDFAMGWSKHKAGLLINRATLSSLFGVYFFVGRD